MYLSFLQKNKYHLILYAFIFLTFLLGTHLGNYGVLKKYIKYYGYLINILIFVSAIYFYVKKDLLSYFKLVLFTVMIADYTNHYILILISLLMFRKKALYSKNNLSYLIFVMASWGLISYLISLTREPDILSYPLFIFTFFAPFIFFNIIYNCANKNILKELYNFFLKLLTINTIIVFAFLIFFWDSHPDGRSAGTTGSHISAFYYIVGFVLILTRMLDKKTNFKPAFYELYLTIVIPLLLFMLDAKYIYAFFIVTCLVMFFLFFKNQKIKIAVLFVLFTSIYLWYNYTDRPLYLSDLAIKTNDFKFDNVYEILNKSSKAELITKAIELPRKDPVVFLTGYGPGTFLSFASNARNHNGIELSYKEFGGKFVLVKNLYTRFFNEYTNKIKKNNLSLFENKFIRYSSFFDWKSSLLAVFFETGIIGLILFLSFLTFLFYQGIKQYKYNTMFKQYGLVIMFLSILFIQLSAVDLWFENPNFGIFVYSLIGAIFLLNNEIITS